MIKRIIGTVLAALLLLESFIFAADGSDGLNYFIDECSDLSKAFEITDKMAAISARYSLLGDAGIIGYYGTDKSSLPYIIYKVDGKIENAEIEAYSLSQSGYEFTVSHSEDGVNYKKLTKKFNTSKYNDKNSDLTDILFWHDGTYVSWKKIIFDIKAVSGAPRYLRIDFSSPEQGAMYVGKVKIGFSKLNEKQIRDAEAAEENILNGYRDKFLALGLIDEQAAVPYTENVKRGNFASDICTLAGISGGDNPLEALAKQGYFAESEELYPNEEIEFNTAVKLLVHVLGYQGIAEAKGGFPNGYLMQAKTTGLLSGVSVKEKLTYADEMKLIKNLIKISPLKMSGLAGGGISYTESEKTFLESEKDIYEGKGIVSATYLTSLTDKTDKAGDQTVKIDGRVYNAGKSNAVDWLGYNTEFYCKDDGNTIIYIAPTDDNKEITVRAEDIADDTTKSRLSYYDERSQKKHYIIDEDADFILNGIAESFKKEKLFIDDGYLKLLDNDDDGKADIVFAESYETAVVGSVDSDLNTITNKIGDSITLEIPGRDKLVRVIKDGKEVTASEIYAGNVISVAHGIGDTFDYYKIYIGTGAASGNISGVKLSDKKLLIDGVQYDISPECFKLSQNGGLPELKPGIYISVMLDAFGRIAYYSSNHAYGFLRKIYSEGTELTQKIYARVFMANGSWASFELCDKVKLNDTSVKKEDVRQTLEDSNGTVPQLIRYKLNSDGKLSAFETAVDVTGSSAETEAAASNDTFRKTGYSAVHGFVRELMTLGWSMFFDFNTVFMQIPDKARYDDESLYTIRKIDENIWTGNIFEGEGYDGDKFGRTPFVLMRDEPRTKMNGTLRVATNFGAATDNMGNWVYSVEYPDGESVLSENTKFIDLSELGISSIGTNSAYRPIADGDIKPGDLYYLVSSANGKEVADVVKWFSIDKWRNNPDYRFTLDMNEYTVYNARFKEMSDDAKIARFEINGGISKTAINMIDTCYLITDKGDSVTVTKASTKDLRKNDYVVLQRGSYLIVRKMFIYRKAD